jgi:hypothetical protein
MSALHDLTLAQQSQALATGQTTSVALTQHALDRIAACNANLGAFLHVNAEGALAEAAAADARRAAGQALGPLDGVPMAHKDIFVTQGQPTTAASKMLKGYMSPFDATVVARLKARRHRSAWARSTATSSPWAAPPRTRPTVARNPWMLAQIARRLVGRLGRGRFRSAGEWHHRLRHRGLDPSASRADRHHRHQADLWPLLALRHDRVCLVAGPGRPDGPHRRRLRPAAAGHERF